MSGILRASWTSLRVERQARERVEHDPARLAHDTFDPRGQLGIVGERGADPDRDRIALGPPVVGEPPALLAGDPLRVAAARGDLAVERHRGLEQHPRPPGPGMLAKRLVEQAGADGELAVGHDHLDPLVAQDAEPAPGGVLARVVRGDHHARDPGRADRLRARRRAAVVAAGLERHVQRRAVQVGPAAPDRLDLGVRAAELLVKALAEDLLVAADDRADERVRADPPAASLGQLDRAGEVAAIDVGRRGHGVWIGRIGRPPETPRFGRALSASPVATVVPTRGPPRSFPPDGSFQTPEPGQSMKLIIQIPCFNEERAAPGDAGATCPREVAGLRRRRVADHRRRLERPHGRGGARARRRPRRPPDQQQGPGRRLPGRARRRPEARRRRDRQHRRRQPVRGRRHPQAGRRRSCAARPTWSSATGRSRRSTHFSARQEAAAAARLVGRAAGVGDRESPTPPRGFRAYNREAALQMQVVSKFTYTLETIIQAGQAAGRDRPRPDPDQPEDARVAAVPVDRRVRAPQRAVDLPDLLPVRAAEGVLGRAR